MDEYERGKLHAFILIIAILLILGTSLVLGIFAWWMMFYG